MKVKRTYRIAKRSALLVKILLTLSLAMMVGATETKSTETLPRSIRNLQSSWTAEQRKDFQYLFTVTNNFIQKESEMLAYTYRDHPNYTVFRRSMEERLHSDFYDLVSWAENMDHIDFKDGDLQLAPSLLEKNYPDLLKSLKDENHRQALAASEMEWLKYRDAWQIFGPKRYIGTTPEQWGAFLSQRRIGDLSQIRDQIAPSQGSSTNRLQELLPQNQEVVFEGTIWKNIHAYLKLKRDGLKVGGTIFYSIDGPDILLVGSIDESGHYVMYEVNEKSIYIGRLTGDYDGHTLWGMWSKPNGQTERPFSFTRSSDPSVYDRVQTQSLRRSGRHKDSYLPRHPEMTPGYGPIDEAPERGESTR